MRDPGCGIRDTGYGILDADAALRGEDGIRDFGMRDS